MPIFRTFQHGEGEPRNRFYVKEDLYQDTWWSTEELLRERSELLRLLGLRGLDTVDLMLATGGRKHFLEELRDLDAELDRREQQLVHKLSGTWRRVYSRETLLLMARLNHRIRVTALLEACGLEATTPQGYETYACPLPTHAAVDDRTFRVFQDDNSWACAPCCAQGSIYELAHWMKDVPLFQRILAGFAESAGFEYDATRWQPRQPVTPGPKEQTGEVNNDALVEAQIDQLFGRPREESREDAA